MMRVIGIEGGHSVYETGTVSDFVLFFECLEYFVVKENSDQDWNLLVDRFYRRYLKLEELNPASILMKQAEEIFGKTASSEVAWKQELIDDKRKTWLDPSRVNLADVFGNFFDNFRKAKESSISFFDAFKIYQPVKIVPADLAGIAIENARSLQEYDALGGKPFWLPQ
ncbi:hypothetical protein [Herbaspirillum sp. VT-16-41]|uniref:hypothetical protein n=1 Tax=Herbaspirillum sp. VT-16-41 TaxID=1953765 RepID=UPI0020C3278C|nr:hypothetical protein [Herbaspirillum sp. VT-16-41]